MFDVAILDLIKIRVWIFFLNSRAESSDVADIFRYGCLLLASCCKPVSVFVSVYDLSIIAYNCGHCCDLNLNCHGPALKF